MTQEAAGGIDLLTAVMHEQGHILGLSDSGSSLMDEYLGIGERRLADSGSAANAVANSLEAEHFLTAAPTNLTSNVPELEGYSLVYQLPVQSSAFNASQYTVDDSVNVPKGSFSRVAYYLELSGNGFADAFAAVTFDAAGFTDDASEIGVPKTTIFEQTVSNMNVTSNVDGVTNGRGLTGNIEFWGTNYGRNANSGLGSTGGFDFDDTRSGGGSYGSMQIHNPGAGETIIAYNRWGTGTGELGIGNRPGTTDTDWTFANNSAGYTVKNLYVLVGGSDLTLRTTALRPTKTQS